MSQKVRNEINEGNTTSALLILFLLPIIANAAQYTAYSLRIAQQRIEQAGENWREKEPDVVNLAGINKVEGFVYDSNIGDLILVGEYEQGRAILTLDDLVVALRARFRYNEWPLVSIDPMPDTNKTQMQHVRFEGGIQNTVFGQAMFDADYRLKTMAMGLPPLGISSLKTYWDRGLEEIKRSSAIEERSVNSRFWFYPINPLVVIREGVCVVRGLRVGVFTEVMAAIVNGKTVEDIEAFNDQIGDDFANDVSKRFDDLCATQQPFNHLRGLLEVVAVSRALEELEERPDLSYWLHKYHLFRVETLKEVKVLRRDYESDDRRGFRVSGGIRLTALAMRLNAGDVTALREAVMKVRPSPDKLSWTFITAEWLIPIGAGQANLEDIAPLFSQALFLNRQERHADSLPIYNEILKLDPQYAEAWSNKGAALANVGQNEEAIQCYERAIEINPRLAGAWSGKGAILHDWGKSQEALVYFDQALEINPLLVAAWINKALALSKLDRSQEALVCFDRALEINPRLVDLLSDKGVALDRLGRIQDGIEYCDRALEINPRDSLIWYNKGAMLEKLGHLDESLRCYEHALEINPRFLEAWSNKGVVLGKLGRYEEGLECQNHALEINPRNAIAWFNKGSALYNLKRYSECRNAVEKAVELGFPQARQILDLIQSEGH